MANEKAPRLESPKGLIMPLDRTAWAASAPKYDYNKDDIGVFPGTSGATVYAPESGRLILSGEGEAVLRVPASDHGRDWIFFNKISGLPTQNQDIIAGQVLGVSDGNLQLALWITPRGQTKSDAVDPAETLVHFKATFPGAPPAAPVVPTNTTIVKAAPSSSPATTSAPTYDSYRGNPWRDKKFSAGHLAAGVAGSLVLGGLIAYGLKGR